MEWNNTIPEWEHEGSEPSDARKAKGFEPLYKIPAGILNWFWCKVTKAIKELQTKFGNHADNKENPHEVTAAQVGLDKVNNTPDSEKAVAFASEAGVGRKVEYALSVRMNGGRTEGTDLWTYDGSTSKSINITADKLGASKEGHAHDTTEINGLKDAIDKIVTAASTDGVSYTATVKGIAELYNGLEITIIPSMSNSTKQPTLNVNGLGNVIIRRPLAFSTFTANMVEENHIRANTPCRLKYHATYSTGGIWLLVDTPKTSAQDLYGTVPIAGGGTGATTAADALTNLGVPALIDEKLANANFPSDDHKHSASDITSGTLPVSRGGTGKSTLTSGYYLVGNGTSAVALKKASDVLSDIGAAPSAHNHDDKYIPLGTDEINLIKEGTNTDITMSLRGNGIAIESSANSETSYYQHTSLGGSGLYSASGAASQKKFELTPNYITISNGGSAGLIFEATKDRCYTAGKFETNGSDFAEFFEYADGNTENEDRRGRMVAFDAGSNKIRLAKRGDNVLGIISAAASFLGDTASGEWHDKYLKDVFGEKIVDADGKWVLNPDYDPEKEYVPREKRAEWGVVGLLGKVVAVDDGTCKVGEYCTVSDNGTATHSDEKTKFYCMKRIDDTHIRVFVGA